MLRIAVVDAGDLWQDYAEALRRVDNVEIGVVVDHDEDAARQLLVSVGGDSFSRAVDELDAHRQRAFNAALVHSPLERRAETACQLAAMGKHLLVDAPLAMSVADVERVVRACESEGTRLMLRQPLRYAPAVQALKAVVDAGKLGGPGLVRLHHWRPDAGGDHHAPATAPSIWDLCYREVDLACWLFNTEPESVFAVRVGEDRLTDGSGIQLHLGFAGGGMALVDCLRTSEASGEPYFMLTLIGSTGAVYVDDHRNTNLLIKDRTTSLRIESSVDVTLQLQEFAAAIATKESSPIQDCRCVTAVLRAALESMDSGRSMPIG